MMRRIIFSTVSGLVYYSAILTGDASGAGGTWRDGAGHAILFGTFGFIMTFPVILLLQAVMTRRVRKWRSKPSGAVPVWEFAPIALMSLLFLSGALPKTPQHYFQRFVADDMPQSVHDLKYWHTRSFGGSSWMLSFRIAPQDFDQVLTRHTYKKTEQPAGIELTDLKIKHELRKDFPVPYPQEKMVISYEYHDPQPGDGLRVWIYANEARDLVYVIGGDG
jgi:hypothetical protein